MNIKRIDCNGVGDNDGFFEIGADSASSCKSGLLSIGMRTALVFSARYAHTRETSAAWVIVNEILENWDRLSADTKAQLKREAKNEATCNLEEWRRLVDR